MKSGEDGPVIAILGEYDALPGLSQEAGVAEPKPLPGDGYGHGCGHNLLGSASMLAATAVKDYLAAHGIKGRVRYYGCPGRGRWRGEGLHGARRCVQRRGRGDLLASCGVRRRERGGVAGQHAHRLHLPWPRVARRRRTASRAQRARRGGADECRRELHARAHAVRRARPLRIAGRRRHRAQRRAGARQGALPDPCPRTARADAADRARAQDRRRCRADDRDAGGIAGGQRGVQPAGQHAAGARDARQSPAPRPAAVRRRGPRVRGEDPGDTDR